MFSCLFSYIPPTVAIAAALANAANARRRGAKNANRMLVVGVPAAAPTPHPCAAPTAAVAAADPPAASNRRRLALAAGARPKELARPRNGDGDADVGRGAKATPPRGCCWQHDALVEVCGTDMAAGATNPCAVHVHASAKTLPARVFANAATMLLLSTPAWVRFERR